MDDFQRVRIYLMKSPEILLESNKVHKDKLVSMGMGSKSPQKP
jgi:hypothetical protein